MVQSNRSNLNRGFKGQRKGNGWCGAAVYADICMMLLFSTFYTC